MSVLRLFLLSLMGLGSSLPALAGPWISSGGDLLGDARNPWYQINTPQVHYCIKHDDKTFSASENDFRTAFNKALKFWQKEFQENQNFSVATNKMPLFIPRFVEVPCSNSEDLTFVLGKNKLTQAQAHYIKNREQAVVALTVRTDYTKSQMKARGFMYIAGDLEQPKWQSNAWKTPERLAVVVAHELGHVFGVPHMSGDFAVMTGIPEHPIALNLMAEGLPAAAVLKSKMGFAFARAILPVFNGTDHDLCNLSSEILRWWQAPAGTQCLRIVMSLDNKPSAFALNEKQEAHLLGHFIPLPTERTLLSSKLEIITQALLNPEQKVFIFSDNLQIGFVVGGTQLHATLNLQFIPVKSPHQSRSTILSISPNELTLMAIDGAKFIPVFQKNRIRPLL